MQPVRDSKPNRATTLFISSVTPSNMCAPVPSRNVLVIPRKLILRRCDGSFRMIN
jgi:hypothetical protein